MKGYGQFCPIAKGAEIFAERWTPLLLRELLSGSRTFNDLQRGVPSMSRSLLSKRLKELEGAGVIERRYGSGPEYRLTRAGEALRPLVFELGAWALRWSRPASERPGDTDPRYLLWDVHRRIHLDRLPRQRVVVQIDFTDMSSPSLTRGWIVLDRTGAEARYRTPDEPVDLTISTSYATLSRVWLGEVGFDAAVGAGDIVVVGEPELASALSGWLLLSEMAKA